MNKRSCEKMNLSDYELQLAKAKSVISRLEELEIDFYGEFKKTKYRHL
ncbi:conserved Plasmodium protein, unknown function [Plasmodium malariae]|uniref:Uncharacterized protein n=1 Tax=Plasmodium malariae TaxID=5858 RepID=A0A1C3KY03_PLAMA|nr:conserved Plasmodium protein, unknown function [Plasmodium malariae]